MHCFIYFISNIFLNISYRGGQGRSCTITNRNTTFCHQIFKFASHILLHQAFGKYCFLGERNKEWYSEKEKLFLPEGDKTWRRIRSKIFGEGIDIWSTEEKEKKENICSVEEKKGDAVKGGKYLDKGKYLAHREEENLSEKVNVRMCDRQTDSCLYRHCEDRATILDPKFPEKPVVERLKTCPYFCVFEISFWLCLLCLFPSG